jgi:hypothetical protein
MKVIQIQLDQFGCGNKIYIVNNFWLLVKEFNMIYQKFNVILIILLLYFF